MKINSNFKDLLRVFDAERVRYLVVGGYAVMKYTEPYGTKDLDIWVEPSEANAEATLRALQRFGAPTQGLSMRDLLNPETIYQIGVEPIRVDVMSHVPGLSFSQAWEHRGEAHFDDVIVPIVSLDDLIVAKRTAGRPKDLIQAEQLEKAKQKAPKRP